MGVCKLVKELNRLRKSSADSIDSEKVFNSFKQYFHVRRKPEDDLKNVLRNVNSSAKKTLVLVCGSAGDGKSHILSYLRNSDPENLLKGYRIHNDATETSAPNKTTSQTLNEVLEDFADDNLSVSGENMILAINLGVLTNFIESEYIQRFSRLKAYAKKFGILSTEVVNNEYDPNSFFQHVNFSDYQMYSLSENGASSPYIEELLDRIYTNKPGNSFVYAFKSGCEVCSLHKECPVYYNFLFLQNQRIQKYIADILVKTIIEKKFILTTRELLNYFYDISIPQNFSYSEISKSIMSDSDTIKQFIGGITPSLMFAQEDVSPLMNKARENDPVLYRTEKRDDFAVSYYVSEDVFKDIEDALEGTPYKEFFLSDGYISEINEDKELKERMFRCLLRIQAMKEGLKDNSIYKNYVENLFWYNTGKKKKLGSLYEDVEKAVLQWCGTDGDEHLCLEQNNKEYSLFESIKFDQDLALLPKESDQKELDRFVPGIKVGFLDSKGNSIACLDIDFSLYLMIHRLKQGYVHTIEDMNDYADFISFIERLKNAGNSDREVYIVTQDGLQSLLKKTKFGYKYEVFR